MELQNKATNLAKQDEDRALSRHEQVAWDTNMLLNIARFKVDVFSEAKKMFGKVDFIVPKQVVEELGMMSEKGLKFKKEVNIAREAMENNNVKIVEIKAKNADEALKKLALEAIIATNDKELKDSVKEMNGKVLYLRQRKLLELS